MISADSEGIDGIGSSDILLLPLKLPKFPVMDENFPNEDDN